LLEVSGAILHILFHINGRLLGIAGGATTAARARRLSETSSIILLQRDPHVSVATCGLPFFIGKEITDKSKLALLTPKDLFQKLAVDVRVSHEVVGINTALKCVSVRNLSVPQDSPGSVFNVNYDKLILSTGAVPLIPSIAGIQECMSEGLICSLRSLEDMDKIISRIDKAGGSGKVVVVGAGFIGIEIAEALIRCGLSVTLVEEKSHIMPILDREMAAPLAAELAHNGVSVKVGSRVTSFSLNKEKSSKRVNIKLSTNENIEADFAVMCIGVRPDSVLAEQAGLKLDEKHGVIVNHFMQTSQPDVYAIGDVASTPFCAAPRQKYLPLGGPANRMARIAADHIFLGDASDPYRGSFGTSIVRAFDAVAGKTGMSEFGEHHYDLYIEFELK
jgi:NADPH-dependent 2,4-dienoyl-CoA reductase/sulfur reductase-like enzyme